MFSFTDLNIRCSDILCTYDTLNFKHGYRTYIWNATNVNLKCFLDFDKNYLNVNKSKEYLT